MPQKWAIRLAVEGDLKFLSHHDVMRAMERVLARAKIPVRFSQGFNPRPVLSLAAPRPVGVASRDDVLVVTLEEPVEAGALAERLNEAAPHGMRFREARMFAGSPPRPTRMTYQTPLDDSQAQRVRQKLAELSDAAWVVRRAAKGDHERGEAESREVDLRPMVVDLSLHDQVLSMTLAPRKDLWARPGEVLRLVGLDERVDLARTLRTSVEYAEPSAPPGPSTADPQADL